MRFTFVNIIDLLTLRNHCLHLGFCIRLGYKLVVCKNPHQPSISPIQKQCIAIVGQIWGIFARSIGFPIYGGKMQLLRHNQEFSPIYNRISYQEGRMCQKLRFKHVWLSK